MGKATAAWTICLAVSFGFAGTVLLAQSQSKKSVPNASAIHTDATAIEAQITPLNMKPGLWQTTMTGKYSGLPAQIASAMNPTRTYKDCVKAANLTRDEWAREVLGLNCSSITVLKSTSTDADIQGKGCAVGNGMSAEGRGKFHLAGPGHLTGSMDATFSGNTPFGGNGSVHMHADYTSNWVGATCPTN
jgi:hypothetical protein